MGQATACPFFCAPCLAPGVAEGRCVRNGAAYKALWGLRLAGKPPQQWVHLRTLRVHVTTTLGEDFNLHPEKPFIERLRETLKGRGSSPR